MKKLSKLLSLLLAAALCLSLSSCKEKDESNVPEEYDFLSTYKSGTIGYVVDKDGKYGVIDREGNYIIEPTFEKIYSTLSENLLMAQDNSQLVYIDMKGNIILRTDADVADEFYDGVAACCYINENDESYEYSYVSRKTGKPLNDTVYYSAKAFSEGYGVCCVKETGLYGFLKPNGKYLVGPQYKNAGSFRNGYASVWVNGLWGFIDKKGKIVIRPRFDNVSFFEKDGLCRAQKNGKWGFIDSTGKFVINPAFDELNNFVDGYAVVCVDAKYGVIDTSGNYIIKPQYDNVLAHSEGLFAINSNGKWGFADTAGKTVIEPKYYFVSVFSEGFAAAQLSENDKCGFIDKTGKTVIEPLFSSVGYFRNGQAVVMTEDNTYGVIDTAGSYVITPEYIALTEILIA